MIQNGGKIDKLSHLYHKMANYWMLFIKRPLFNKNLICNKKKYNDKSDV